MDSQRDRVVVCDWDGFFSDAEQEGGPFVAAYLADLAKLTGFDEQEVARLAVEFEARIAAEPDKHGWLSHRVIVAPARVDPYMRMMAVARLMFDRVGRFMDPQDREVVLNFLYESHYKKTKIVFRPGAREAFLALWAYGRDTLYVVTNSAADAVCDKICALVGPLEGLEEWLSAHVVGGAKKYDPDEVAGQEVSWSVPAVLELPGLNRPVQLHRPRYFRTLDAIRQRHSARFEDLVVGGDIFEMDLALPLTLGARVALLASERTPAYELPFLAQHPRGRVLTYIREFPAFAMGE
ncbi:hypothetical protein HYW17_02445 [Candidatus Uhrbacteria bacterium]|nr:hypothetical protein [Candidatus Uhrbacteria bacterium]